MQMFSEFLCGVMTIGEHHSVAFVISTMISCCCNNSSYALSLLWYLQNNGIKHGVLT